MSGRWTWRGLLALSFVLVLVSVPGQRRARAGDYAFGSDRDSAATDEMLEALLPDLVSIVSASSRTRNRAAESLVRRQPSAAIEVLKRCRSPELIPLFKVLVKHPDWRVRHRALLAVGRIDHAESYEIGYHALRDDDPRVQIRAAITCIETWDAKEDSSNCDPSDFRKRLAIEDDTYVAGALEALLEMAEGGLDVQVVQKEPRVRLAKGLQFVPFVRGWENFDHRQVRARPKPFRRSHSRLGSATPVAEVWLHPVLDSEKGLIQDPTIEGFGQARDGEATRHAGTDVSAGADGAGVFAIGAGAVRDIRAGGPEGTVIAVQYHLADGRLVDALHMHCGETVFVKCGDVVKPGQLLGTVGMAYSMGNGGRVAHLHFALCPTEATGRPSIVARVASRELYGWYDPAWYQARWTATRRPFLPPISRGYSVLEEAYEALDAGRYADAVELAGKSTRDPKLSTYVQEGAMRFVARIETGVYHACEKIDERVGEIRNLGYPSTALALLQRIDKTADGMNNVERVRLRLEAWTADPDLQREIDAETKLLAVHRAALARRGQEGAAKAAERDYVALLEEFGDTPLEARIEMLIRGCRTG